MFGSAREIVRPKFKVSSLSHRYSQYKKFVTAYLMNKKNHDEMVLSWHAMIVKAEDLQEDWHSIAPFDLDYSMLKAKFTVNTLDEPLSVEQSTPPANSNWLVPAYQNALVNFTNESMNYSFTTHFGHDWTWPGPYLTEKTMKPLLAGRPFLAVGQYRTYDRLALLGFRSDFGWDISFDRQPGDRTRMIEIFRCIDSIFAQTIDSMFDQSIDACKHNLQIIKSGSVLEHAQQVNQKAVDIIKNL
jgi:hypothetical protein